MSDAPEAVGPRPEPLAAEPPDLPGRGPGPPGAAYLRYPHLHGDLLCFAAEDDLWIAPVAPDGEEPGRAWRLTVDRTRVGHPRFSPDGAHIAFTTWRSLDPEVHLAPVDGGPAQPADVLGQHRRPGLRLDTARPRGPGARPRGLLARPAVLVLLVGLQRAHRRQPRRPTALGPVSDIAVADVEGERRTLLLSGKPPHEPASWKRYRGGAMGRMWLHGTRLMPDLYGHLDSVMFVGGRVAFLSDHEGIGNIYSCLPDSTDLQPAHRPRRLLCPARLQRRFTDRLPVQPATSG